MARRQSDYFPTPVPPRYLVCLTCGARRHCPLRAVALCARAGWPRCCDEVMVLTAGEPLGCAGGVAEPGGEWHLPDAEQ